MHIQAYLHFDGRCEQAIAFYRKVLGAELDMMMRYKESPEPPPPGMVPPDWGDKIMHSNMRIGDSVVMAADDCTGGPVGTRGCQLVLNVADEAQARRCFDALADGGKVRMPLSRTFFSPGFGMLNDRFGVQWMIIVPEEKGAS